KAQGLFEGIGFKKEGLLKEDIRNQAQLVDRFAYGVLKEEFDKRNRDKRIYLNPSPIAISNISLNNNKSYIKRDERIPMYLDGIKQIKALYFYDDIEKNK